MSALDEKVSRLDEKVSDLRQKVTKVQVHLENDVSKKEVIRMNDNELLQKILADLQGIKAEQLKLKEELQTFRAETREELSRINKMLNENFETTQVELVKR